MTIGDRQPLETPAQALVDLVELAQQLVNDLALAELSACLI